MNDLSKIKWSPEDLKNWREALRKYYNIETLNSLNDFNQNTDLIITRCSQKKSGNPKGIPSQMYWGSINKKFYRIMDSFGLYYGICSDLLGIVFKDEEFEDYNVHPSDITDEDKRNLGKIIKEKVNQKGYKRLFFFNTSPLLSRPYFEMLYYSQIQVKYFSDLQIIRKAFEIEDDLL